MVSPDDAVKQVNLFLDFTREQVKFVVETILSGALDRMVSVMPFQNPSASKQTLAALLDVCKEVVGTQVAFLWGQLSGEGMGIGDFAGMEEFSLLAERLLKRSEAGENVDVPDVSYIAEIFVSEYYR